MSFYDAMREGIITRMEQIEPELTRTSEYRAAHCELDSELDSMPADSADRVRETVTRLFDLYSRYFYAAGIQDGQKITGEDFPLQMID